MKKIAVFSMFLFLMGFGALAQASLTDTVQYPTGFFCPDPASTYSAPYYRGYGQDWGWTHSLIGGTINSAELNISAWDVDASSGEVDEIYAYDNGTMTYLGNLLGANDQWAFTNFVLGANFYDDIAAGLEVFMKIDTATQGYWLVTLGKSVLSIDGGTLPPPTPGAVPIPATALLIAPGLAGLAAIRRKMQK